MATYVLSVLDEATGPGTPEDMAAIDVFHDRSAPPVVGAASQ
jgi:hypothetical protein